jgi:alginate O-acetyltransferase complex protein AlgI
MAFNSLQFPIFAVIFFGVYFACPSKLRRIWILIASCIFYMTFIPAYLLILASLIFVDYSAGLGMELIGDRSPKFRRLILWASLAANIGTLAIFKYYNFFAGTVEGIFSFQLPIFAWVLPLGLSFHTFQSMSYVIEVYRKTESAERSILTYALYVMFWPQLVAGPIERPDRLLPQLRENPPPSPVGWRLGLVWILVGFIKKVVIADRLAIMVSPVFSDPDHYSWQSLLLASYFFSFQIYCDFSGYTDIARGFAKLMGYQLVANFRQPYLAQSVSDFWRRWHISLSTWFRDYVYIPLGGNRASVPQNCPPKLWGFVGGFCFERHVARGQLDLSSVGRLSRRLTHRRKTTKKKQPESDFRTYSPF